MPDSQFEEPADLSDVAKTRNSADVPLANTAPVALAYAPPARSRSRPVIALAGGLLTSVLALVGVYALRRAADTDIMGWYYIYIIPVGAMVVGGAAASGYGLAAWKLGIKIQRWFFVTMMLLLVACFFAAKYVEFRMQGPLPQSITTVVTPSGARMKVGVGQLSFFQYFHQTTINWTWKRNTTRYDYDDRDPPKPIGTGGYVFQLLGIIGFGLGGAAVPSMLTGKPYCELCERYNSTTQLAIMPPNEGTARYQRLDQAAKRGDVEGCRDLLRLGLAGAKEVDKLQRRIVYRMVYCQSCAAGQITLTERRGRGKQKTEHRAGRVQLQPQFLQALRKSLGYSR